MPNDPVIFWFRRDLRLHDNPGLIAAQGSGRPIIPLYIRDDEDGGDWAPGAASNWWLHGSLASLARDLETLGNGLILRSGPARAVLDAVSRETGATAIYWNRRYEPWAVARDKKIKAALSDRGLEVVSCQASLLREPWEIRNQQGQPYKVFTPFWKTLRALGPQGSPLAPPERLPALTARPISEELESWRLRPTEPDWAMGLREAWDPGEAGAGKRLESFLEQAVFDYKDQRDLPGITGTSRLSPHLHFGEIGPRQVWHAATTAALAATGAPMPRGVETFLSEIAWREFSHHLLFQFPDLPTAPLRPEFSRFSWEEDDPGLSAWQRGQTGYPIVDAGMRELWATGWMHNRVRMIVASFLIKDLLIPWQRGEAWFWDTLVDADLANNAASWQWVAGCGADAAPYFRVFNPITQGEKFDPEGAYIRQWVPELAKLPKAVIHQPWSANPLDLAEAGLALGREYPLPIVDHAMARKRALERFNRLKSNA
ncbi:MAG: cryptochrome/photolyase family protein [Magnetospiraceae bacterium]